MTKNWLISRRTFLRGCGIAMALPLLETMGWAEEPPGRSNPIRSMFIFAPNGVIPSAWRASLHTTAQSLPRILQPLAPVWSEVIAINNLSNAVAENKIGGAHARGLGALLTGVQIRHTGGADLQAGISIDQVIADKVGVYTSLPSLELSITPGPQAGGCEGGYSCAYISNMSWRSPATPTAREAKPKAVFDRLFNAKKNFHPRQRGGPVIDTKKLTGGAAQAPTQANDRSIDQSILDLVLGDAQRLRGQVSSNDQRKLDEYLDSVRALERRVEFAHQQDSEAAKATAAKRPGKYSSPIEVMIPPETPTSFPEHVKLMMDLTILAFQTDTTRVCSLMYGVGLDNRPYPHLGINKGHHEMTHLLSEGTNTEDVIKINTHHVELLAYLLTKMKSLNDGRGSLLDNSMVFYSSDLGRGDWHTHTDLPVLLAGRAGGTITPGRVLEAKGKMSDLHLAIAARAGAPVSRHGDSDRPLEGLS
jgi:Protein of unknown function (DUF1552)